MPHGFFLEFLVTLHLRIVVFCNAYPIARQRNESEYSSLFLSDCALGIGSLKWEGVESDLDELTWHIISGLTCKWVTTPYRWVKGFNLKLPFRSNGSL